MCYGRWCCGGQHRHQLYLHHYIPRVASTASTSLKKVRLSTFVDFFPTFINTNFPDELFFLGRLRFFFLRFFFSPLVSALFFFSFAVLIVLIVFRSSNQRVGCLSCVRINQPVRSSLLLCSDHHSLGFVAGRDI